MCVSVKHACIQGGGEGSRGVSHFSVPPRLIKKTYVKKKKNSVYVFVICLSVFLELGRIFKLSDNKRKPGKMEAALFKITPKIRGFFSSGISCPVCLKDASLSWKHFVHKRMYVWQCFTF